MDENQPQKEEHQSVEDMIQAVAFPGDTDEILKSIQALFHFELMGHLAMQARERYLAAADFLGTDDDLPTWLRAHSHFINPDALKSTYVTIAAAYRFYHAGQSQLALGQNPDDHWEAVKSGWVRYFQAETKQLTTNGRITRAILESCRFRRTDLGADAQDRLIELLPSRYYDLPGGQNGLTGSDQMDFSKKTTARIKHEPARSKLSVVRDS